MHRRWFGVRGKHFETMFLIREAFEIAVQSIQAQRLSRWVPRPNLNSVHMGLLVINCWSTPAIKYRY
ncbi:TPA: hypothetical protein N0F65_010319 [Lagenidium giganteum]|uniref:Uncharacterized protein n=1 Tax=Lagenidium giganteum TaxID=4803 RepID=A0AAV2Z8R6_9STRA|nr:TPA: hypothetical protein N0F65_010319 [Lagenidium giganteum]